MEDIASESKLDEEADLNDSIDAEHLAEIIAETNPQPEPESVPVPEDLPANDDICASTVSEYVSQIAAMKEGLAMDKQIIQEMADSLVKIDPNM